MKNLSRLPFQKNGAAPEWKLRLLECEDLRFLSEEDKWGDHEYDGTTFLMHVHLFPFYPESDDL